MNEIDLVPPRYNRRRRVRRWTIRAFIAYGIVLLAVVVIRVGLDRSSASYSHEIDSFKLELERAAREQDELTALSVEQRLLAQRLAVLEQIRGDDMATAMFEVVDQSLDSDVWFRHWSYARADEIVDPTGRAVETGYFIVLPKENSDQPERAWRRSTHMEIQAEAEDHTALAGFVRRLSQRDEIGHARILSTQSQTGAQDGVQFEVAVTVGGKK